MAQKMKAKSISIPAISSGIFGFPKDLCASILFDAAIEFADKYPESCLNNICYTNFDMPTVQYFLKEAQKRYS